MPPIKRILLFFSVLAIGLLLAFYFFADFNRDEELLLKPLQQRIQLIEKEFDQDFIELLMRNRPEDGITFSSLSIKFKHPYFVFDQNDQLLYWSDFSFVPDIDLIKENPSASLLEDRVGTFFVKVRKFSRREQSFTLVQVFPLVLKRELQNDFLYSGPNKEIFGNANFKLSTAQEDGFLSVFNGKGAFLFSIDFLSGYQPVGHASNVTLLVFFFSLFLLVIILGFGLVKNLWIKGKYFQSVLYSGLILFAVRAFMIFFRFPQDYFDVALFDPSKFASSAINPSLGDLLLNMLSLMVTLSMLLGVLAGRDFQGKVKQALHQKSPWLGITLLFLISSLLLQGFYGLYINILSNSQWDLNILSLPSFDYFKGISLLIVFMGGAIYLLFSMLGISILLQQAEIQKGQVLKIMVLISLPIMLLLLWLDWVLVLVFLTHFIFLVSVVSFSLYNNIFKLGLNTFLTFFFGALIAAIITGIASHKVFLERQLVNKERFGNQQLLDSDVMAEYFLSDIMNKISEDLFIKNALTDPLQSKEAIERKIRKIHITNYFDQYAFRVKVFNQSGENVLVRNDEVRLQGLRKAYIKSDYATSVRGLYFTKDSEGAGGNQYFAFIPLSLEDVQIGTVYLELKQLRVIPGSIFPKLLMDSRYMSSLNEKAYDYAVYADGQLKYSLGVFNFRAAEMEKNLDDPALYQGGIYRKKYHHLGLRGQDEVIVVSSPVYPVYYILADISLFFLSYIILTLVSVLVYALFRGASMFRFNYATKLQMYLNFAFFFPILFISIIIVGLLTNSYQEELNRQYIQKSSILRDNLATILEKQEEGLGEREEFLEAVNSLSTTTNTDINVYGPQGYLMTSSQPNIFDKNILTRYINPQAIVQLIEGQNNVALLEEKIGRLNYKSVYTVIRTADAQQIKAIIGVPFFESESELDLLIADVLSNIINIFVAVFILFLFVSYFVSKNLTFPFKLLTQKLKATGLENNEPMYWPTNDEIGLLVNEYNNMLYKLEASKKILSNTEKESAWREMAKQVAHEIKNPLTPMKLTLQHLLRLQAEGKLDDSSMLKKPVETLIHQVDTLSDIATSFSTFAKMPLPKNEALDLRKVVMDVLELFKNREKGTVTLMDKTDGGPLMVMGDDQLFGRVISNLVINGIQAVDLRKKPQITVCLSTKDGEVVLEIKDNGKGIPEELKDKIFIPNFSTKSEGSGLGLAIAKRGVETAGGEIWFETTLGKGSTFYLAFPLIANS